MRVLVEINEDGAECEFGRIEDLRSYLRYNPIDRDTAPEVILVGREWADEIFYSESFDDWCGVETTVHESEDGDRVMRIGGNGGLEYVLHQAEWADKAPTTPLYVGRLAWL